MRWVVLLVMAGGCRQFFGLDPVATRDGGRDGIAIDGPRDSQGGTCIERWKKGPQFGPVGPVAGVNTMTNDRAPFVTTDGAQLYFVHDNDFFVATNNNGQGFGSAVRDDMLSSGATDARIYVSNDKLRAFFASQRPGGDGATDLWRAARPSESDPWLIDQMYLAALNGNGDQSDPFLSDDLLRMYYVAKVNQHQIVFADRASTSLPFSAGTPVTELATASDDEQPTLTSNELVIVFTSKRSGNGDLYYATRESIQGPFDPPILVPQLNHPNRADESPYVTPDGCGLYFASDRAGSMDLYAVSLLD